MINAIRRPRFFIRTTQILRRYGITNSFNLLMFGLTITLLIYLI
jgi:hypothetical protein